MFQPGKELKRYWRSFLRIIYPASCTACHLPLYMSETDLCRMCREAIEVLKAPLCLKCASPLPPFGSPRATCSQCRSERRYFDRGFALVKYEEPVRTVMHQLKFHQKPWLLRVFSPWLEALDGSNRFRNYDLIVPVPLDRRRELERGFNQALMIARTLTRVNRNTGPVRQILKKRKRTLPQSQLKREERLVNLNGAFSLQKRTRIAGKQVLLVDDIFTTGSTINECAKTLKEGGAECVDFLTLARS